MAIGRKENGSLVKKAGKMLVDLALNRSSNRGIANSVVSNSLMDGIGNTNEVFRFGTDGAGNYGYIKKVDGADTFRPFKSPSGTYYVEDAGLIDISDYEYVEVPRILAVSSGPTTYPGFTYTNPRDVAVQVKVKVSMTYSNVYNDAYMTVSVAGVEKDRVGLGVLVDKMYTVPAGSTLVIQGNLYNPYQHSGVLQTISGTVYAYDG